MKVPITDLQPIDRDELVTLLSDNNMLLAQQRLLPVKVNKDIFTFELDGEVENREVLAAILNGKIIDTSASID